jgi:hypothetical protein
VYVSKKCGVQNALATITNGLCRCASDQGSNVQYKATESYELAENTTNKHRKGTPCGQDPARQWTPQQAGGRAWIKTHSPRSRTAYAGAPRARTHTLNVLYHVVQIIWSSMVPQRVRVGCSWGNGLPGYLPIHATLENIETREAYQPFNTICLLTRHRQLSKINITLQCNQ